MDIPTSVKKIIIDGSNVARSSYIGNKKANIINLLVLIDWINEIKAEFKDIDIRIIVDPGLKYCISDKSTFSKLCKKGQIQMVPPLITADDFIVKLMKFYEDEIMVISNDRFRDYPVLNSMEIRIQYGFMILFDRFVISPMKFGKKNRKNLKVQINGIY